MTVGVEHVHKAVARSRDVVLFRSVLPGVSHEQVAIDVYDTKRGVASRQSGIDESAARRHRRELTVRARRTEDIDPSRPEVGRIEESSLGAQAEHEALVD